MNDAYNLKMEILRRMRMPADLGEMASLEYDMKIVDEHERWPVLVETAPGLELADVYYSDLNQAFYRISKRILWMTQQEYIKKFGTEPPTAPIIKILMEKYGVE